MTLLVPFDGSSLSETALDRAVKFGSLMGEDVLAVTVLPGEESYARTRGWLGEDEPFDPDAIGARLEQQVRLRAPESRFELRRPDDVEGSSVTMDVIRTIRRAAADVDASIPFVDVFGRPPREVPFEFYCLAPDSLTGRTESWTEVCSTRAPPPDGHPRSSNATASRAPVRSDS